MLKKMMFLVAVFSTVLRLADLIYLTFLPVIHLPLIVMIFSCIIVVFGLYLIFRTMTKSLRHRTLVMYYLVSAVLMTFNILYVAFGLPVNLSLAESIAVGSLLDILLALVFLYYSFKQIRTHYRAVDQNKPAETRNPK